MLTLKRLCTLTYRSPSGADKKKKKKKTTPPLHPWGRPVGGRDGDKIDIDAMALKLVGLDPEPLLKLVGCPEDLTFNDMTKLEACDIDESDFAALGVEDGDYKAAKKAANKKADKIIRQREKTFPAWCFLAYQAVDRVPKKEGQKPRNLCPISYDGKTVNTKLLLKKVDVFAKQRALARTSNSSRLLRCTKRLLRSSLCPPSSTETALTFNRFPLLCQ